METMEQIINLDIARSVFGHCDDGSLTPDDAEWKMTRIQASDFVPLMDNGVDGWRAWLADECANWRKEYGSASHWEMYLEVEDLRAHLKETSDGPCVASAGDDGRIQIWDGWHRIAAQIVRGEPEIEVLLGRRIHARPDVPDYYHGTFWARPRTGETIQDCIFFELDEGYSDLGAVFVTNSEDTATYFAKWNTTSPHDIQVMLKGRVSVTNLLERSSDELVRSPRIKIGEVEHEISEREDLFDALRGRYDGFAIRGNYDGSGDDIALFDGTLFHVTEAKLLIDGTWTQWMDRGDAEIAFAKACGLYLEPDGDTFAP